MFAILGILAAATYAVFVGRTSPPWTPKRSRTRSLLWKVHTCFTSHRGLHALRRADRTGAAAGCHLGREPGEVYVDQGTATTRYTVTVRAVSKAKTDGHNTRLHDRQGSERAGGAHLHDGTSNDVGGCSGGAW